MAQPTGNARPQRGQSKPQPAGQAIPDTPETGEAVCPQCRGAGWLGGKMCPACEGSGQIIGDG